MLEPHIQKYNVFYILLEDESNECVDLDGKISKTYMLQNIREVDNLVVETVDGGIKLYTNIEHAKQDRDYYEQEFNTDLSIASLTLKTYQYYSFDIVAE